MTLFPCRWYTAHIEARKSPRVPFRRKALLTAITVAASLLLSFGVAEVAVRATHLDSPRSDRGRVHSIYGWTVNPRRPDMDGLNADGFRFEAVPRAKPPGVRRLVLLGDSFTLGGAFPHTATYPAILDRWLADSGESWQVLSFNAGGWGTAQQLLALRHDALAYDPDVVVLQVLPFNDLCNNTLALAFACDLQDDHRPYFVIDEADGSLRRTWLHPKRATLRRSALYRLVERKGWFGLGPPVGPSLSEPVAYREWLQSVHQKHSLAAGLEMRPALYTFLPPEESPATVRQSWEITDRLFEETAQQLEARSIPRLAIVVPYPESFDAKRMESFRRPGPWPRHPEGAPNLRGNHATGEMERALAQHGFTVLSLRSELEQQPITPRDAYYPFGKTHDRHFNRLGHFLTAGWLLEVLREAGHTEARGQQAALEATGPVDLIADEIYPISVRGFREPRGQPLSREARGRKPSLAFMANRAQQWRLTFRMRPVDQQRAVQLWVNDKLFFKHRFDAGLYGEQVDFWSRPGRNEIRFVFRPGQKGDLPVAHFDQLRLEPLEAASPRKAKPEDGEESR